MRTKPVFRSLTIGMALIFSLTGCRREFFLADSDTSPAADFSMAETYYNDAANISDEAATTGDVEFLKSGQDSYTGCFTVTRDTLSSPRVVTIDFGSSNCMCNDGRNRRGKIIVTYTGAYRAAGTVITVSYDNYFVNDNQLLGTHTITNMGTNGSGNVYYTVDVNGQVALSNGGTVTWTSSRTREWIAGYSTPECSDDIYSITGSASGTRANGMQVTAVITSPLIRNMDPNCRRHFTQGVIEITPENHPVRILDYGNGDCDNTATVTINGNTYTIMLGS